MEEKKVFKINNSVRTVFNFRNFNQFVLCQFNFAKNFTPSRFLKKSSGFTLVELIVVIGILGILATAGLVALNPIEQFKKANDSKRKSDLAQVQKALETYYQDVGSYPRSSLTGDSSIDYQIQVPDTSGTKIINWGSSWAPYMNLVPKDPSSSTKHYSYYSSGTGQSYYLYASLDRDSDPQLCHNLNTKKQCPTIDTNFMPNFACGGECNYGVTSPNVSP